MLVDLREIEPAVLARYMGKAASAAFRAHHARDGLRPMTSRMGLQRSSMSAVQ
jgi:hypothetical protein